MSNYQCSVLPITLYGLEAFALPAEQRHKVAVAYNNITRKVFRVGRLVLVQCLLASTEFKSTDFLIDKRRLLLGHECLSSVSSLL